MALASGLDAQFGMAEETTYGTFVSPTRFLEFNSESIVPDVRQIMSRGLGRARTQHASHVLSYVAGAGGDVQFDVMNAGFGLLFKHMLGVVATTGTETPYTHTFTPDANGLKGKSISVQIAKPDTSGTLRPFNFYGGKVASWSMSCQLDQPLQLTVTIDFQGMETTTAAGTKSYASGAAPLVFVHGSATIDGAAVDITAFDLTGDNGLNLQRRFLGNTKKEPLASGELVVTGNFTVEFEDLTRTGQIVNGTQLDDLVLTFSDGTNSLTITVAKFLYTAGSGIPQVGGPDVLTQQLPWKALDDRTNPLITIEYVTSDATP